MIGKVWLLLLGSAVLVATAASTALAGGTDTLRTDTTAQRVYKAEPVVVTGQSVPRPISDVPMQVRFVNAETIRNRAAVNLGDALRSELNIRLATDNVLGTALSMNGVSGENVKILVDGVPVVGRLNGNIDVTQLALDNIERIEIVDGPMSAQYGTDALGGTINLITRSAPDSVEASGMIRYESAGSVNTMGGLSAAYGPVALRVFGGRQAFLGWRPTGDPSARAFQWRPRETFLADVEALYRLDDLRLRYTARFSGDMIWTRGEPRPPFGETAIDSRFFTTRLTHTVDLAGKGINGQPMTLLASLSTFDRVRRTSVKNFVTLEDRQTADPSENDTNSVIAYALRGVHSASLLGASIDVGIEANHEVLSGRRLRLPTHDMTDVAAFAVANIHVDPVVLLQPAVRFAHNSRFQAPIIPSLSLRMGTGNLTGRATVARGFRAPSLRELFMDFVDVNHDIQGTDALHAEHSWTSRVSARWAIDSWDDALVVIEPALLINDITNMIALASITPTQFSYQNIGHFRSMGATATASINLPNIILTVGWSTIWRTPFAGTSRALLPANELSADFSTSISWLESRLALQWKYTGALPLLQQADDGSLINGQIEGFHMLDITWSARPFSFVSMQLGLRNVLDVRNILATQTGTAHSGGGSMPVAWGRSVVLLFEISNPW